MKKAAQSTDANSSSAALIRSLGDRTRNSLVLDSETDKPTNETASNTAEAKPQLVASPAVPNVAPKIITPKPTGGIPVAQTPNTAASEQTVVDEPVNEEALSSTPAATAELSADVPEGDEDLKKVDSPKNFANQYFKGVSGYDWEKLKVYLGSDGSREANLKLRQLLNIFILHNKPLSPSDLWHKIETDPSGIKGYEAFQVYYGKSAINVGMNADVSLKTTADLDAGLDGIEKTVTYTPRHFIFLTKKNIERSQKASEETTAFIEHTAGDIQGVMDGINANKQLLEADLKELTSGLNTKLSSDASSKNQLANTLTGNVQERAKLAREGVIADYHKSLEEIDKNTNIQKQKIRTQTNQTAGKLVQLKGSQQAQLDEKFNSFKSDVALVSNEQKTIATKQGNDRAAAMAQSNFGDKKGEAVKRVAKDVSNEIQDLSQETIKTALGKEDKASTPYQASLSNLYNELSIQEKLLNDQSKEYKESARVLMEAHITKIDELAITAIASLTHMLEIYFAKLADFGEMEEEVIGAFYSKSVGKLDAASKEMIDRSRERIASFQASQSPEEGLKKPSNRKRRKTQERITEEITPWLAEAEHESGEASVSNQAELATIQGKISSTFSDISTLGADNLSSFAEGVYSNINTVREKATPVIAAVSAEHVGSAKDLTAEASKKIASEVETLKQAYQDQLASVETKLQDKLTSFQLGAEEIIMDLKDRMDQAEMDVSVEDADNEAEHGIVYNGFQAILDNSPINYIIKDFLERWRSIPKSKRDTMMKVSMKHARAILERMRNTPSSWLDDLINMAFPMFKNINSFMREFQIGFLTGLIELPDTKLADAMENLMYNQTRLDFYMGMGQGIVEGMAGWVMDIVDTVKSVGEFLIDLFNIPEHIKKIEKISGKVADALKFIATQEGQQKFLAIIKNFNPETLLDSIGAAILGFAQNTGKSIAQALVEFMLLSPKAMGIKIGQLMGYIIMEILVAVFSAGIGTAIKASLKGFQVVMKVIKLFTSTIGKVTRKLAGEALDAFGDAKFFINSLMKMLRDTGKDSVFLHKLHEFVEGMMDFMKTKVEKAKNAGKDHIELDEVSGKGTKLDEVSKSKSTKAKVDVDDYTKTNKDRLRDEVKKDLNSGDDYTERLEDAIKAFAIIEMNDALDPSPPAIEVVAFLNAMIDLPKNDKFTSRHISGDLYDISFNPNKKYTEGGKKKPVDVPSLKNAEFDWSHIFENHSDWGKVAKQSGKKDIFQGLNEVQIREVVMGAYNNIIKHVRSKTQDGIVKMVGKYGSWEIEFIVNTKTKIIETAYPLGRKII